MKYVHIPHHKRHSVAFYLAAEEYVARNFDNEEYFMMWQVGPSVIFGRNQLIENEVNLDFCRKQGIETFRRKSGGGCVYADWGNIMMCYIQPGDQVQFIFDRYIRMVAHLLSKLGLDAHASNRNDVLIGGKKVSGNAFYHIPGKNIVHGTMLFDTCMENMVESITPNRAKLESKGVDSIRQHITLLKDYLTIDIQQFQDYVRDSLCSSSVTLTDKDLETIEEMEKGYLLPEFIYGNNPRYSLTRHKRIEGCGDFDVRMELKNGIIKKVNLVGDFFLCGDLDQGLLQRLNDTPYTYNDIRKAICDVPTQEIILNLTPEQFIELIIDPT